MDAILENGVQFENIFYAHNYSTYSLPAINYNINNELKNNFKSHTLELCIGVINIVIIPLFAHSETMIVSIEHSKTHSKYKYILYIQQYITV